MKSHISENQLISLKYRKVQIGLRDKNRALPFSQTLIMQEWRRRILQNQFDLLYPKKKVEEYDWKDRGRIKKKYSRAIALGFYDMLSSAMKHNVCLSQTGAQLSRCLPWALKQASGRGFQGPHLG